MGPVARKPGGTPARRAAPTAESAVNPVPPGCAIQRPRRAGRELACSRPTRLPGEMSLRQTRAYGRWPAAGPQSECVDLVRLRALGALADGVLHLLALCQGAVAAHVDRRVVDEDIGCAVIGGDKTIALVCVEPFHGSLSHLLSPSRDEPGDPRTLRGSAAGRSPPEEIHKQSETPTVKTAGVFTIADFDNNSNLKHVRGQSIPAPAHLRPHPQPVRTGRPHPPSPPDQVRTGRCSSALAGGTRRGGAG